MLIENEDLLVKHGLPPWIYSVRFFHPRDFHKFVRISYQINLASNEPSTSDILCIGNCPVNVEIVIKRLPTGTVTSIYDILMP